MGPGDLTDDQRATANGPGAGDVPAGVVGLQAPETGREIARLFEEDTAAPLDFKALVLRRERAVARCERIIVAVDLREDRPGALAAAGHGEIERFGADAVPGSAASLWVSEMPDDPVGWPGTAGRPPATPARTRYRPRPPDQHPAAGAGNGPAD
ncbi:Leucine carboxyl methyltransferase [Streptomyces sp. 3214.6]|nr:Leucine carboxyl methyltransferase [Streptomyces sp. 3214.6]